MGLDESVLLEIREAAEIAAQGELGRWHGLGIEASDIAMEVVAKVLESQTMPDNPRAYGTTFARRLVWTRVRSTLRRGSREHAYTARQVTSESDDVVARRLGQGVTAAQVTTTLRYALGIGDQVGVRVVVTWLRLAEELGEAPTAVRVADETDPPVTRQTVAAVLKRFRSYLAATGAEVEPF
ncbi:MAG: hypothetical protein GY926_22755 [bacterium]|nr:hypothetical protein [bacterium]